MKLFLMNKALKKMERFYKLVLVIFLGQDNQTKDQKMNKPLRKNLRIVLGVIVKRVFKLKIKSINKLNHPEKEVKCKMQNRQIK